MRCRREQLQGREHERVRSTVGAPRRRLRSAVPQWRRDQVLRPTTDGGAECAASKLRASRCDGFSAQSRPEAAASRQRRHRSVACVSPKREVDPSPGEPCGRTCFCLTRRDRRRRPGRDDACTWPGPPTAAVLRRGCRVPTVPRSCSGQGSVQRRHAPEHPRTKHAGRPGKQHLGTHQRPLQGCALGAGVFSRTPVYSE